MPFTKLRSKHKLRVLFVIGVVGAIGSVGLATRARTMEARSDSLGARPSQQPAVAIVDGAKDPNAIPDSVAFSMVFHVLADHESYPVRATSYLRHIGIGSRPCPACPNGAGHSKQPADSSANADAEALLTLADAFQARVTRLESEARRLYEANKNNINPAVRAQFKDLYSQKLAVAQDLIDELPRQLSADGYAAIRSFVDSRVKPRMKMVAN